MNKKIPPKVLILCTGNSARSIIGEYLLRAKGNGRFEVHSAGSKPTGRVNPLAIRVLAESYGIDASAGRSKSWDEFKGMKFDLVITVCDNAKETCPVWPGQPLIAHWGSPDPAGVEGTEEEKYHEFVEVASQLAHRVDLFCAFPEEKLLDATAVRAVGDEFKLAGETDDEAMSAVVAGNGTGCAESAGAAAPSVMISTLKSTLAAAPELPITVLWPDGDPIEAHFHVTEVGRVQKDFVDCGGTVRRLVTCLLQTWVGEDTDHRITAGKLLKAFEHSALVLGDVDLPVELEYEACNVFSSPWRPWSVKPNGW